MTTENLQYAFLFAIGVIGWFLKGVMADFKSLKNEVIEHDRTIGIIKADQSNSNKRFDELNANFKALSDKIDNKIEMILTKLNSH